MRFILGIVIGIVVVIFIVQNTEVATVTFLSWTLTVSRAVMYLVIFALGLVIGWISRSFRRHRPQP